MKSHFLKRCSLSERLKMHQKDIQEKDPFGQNRNEADEAEAEADEKSFLKALQLRWERLKMIQITMTESSLQNVHNV